MGGSVPLGYQADGRTLKIDEAEAETIRTLYDLYLEHRTLRDVKERAETLDLRSRRREQVGGRVSGGKHFDRGHIQHILSNPIYAGRIRHKKQTYNGQHPAIIDPPNWDKVQDMLQSGAAVARGSRQKATRSLLAGKLFDETGDRLTPSHSRKNGKRLRYYISCRLVKDRSRKHPQTRTAGIANRDCGVKSARFVLSSASLLKFLSAKRPKTRDNRVANSQRLKTGKCLAGVVGFSSNILKCIQT